MTQLLIKYGNIALTTTIIRPGVHTGVLVSCPLLLVRLGGYIVNLSEFYSYRLIGKLTERRVDSSFLVLVFHRTDTHIQDFSLALALLIHNKQLLFLQAQ
jgi:hypothetical protein